MAKPPKKHDGPREPSVLGMLDAIDPDDMLGFQRTIFNITREQLPRAREVLRGTRKWDPIQAKIFLAMLGKSLPDLKVSKHSTTTTTKNVNELSTEQLRAIVAAAEAKTVDATPIPEENYQTSPLLGDHEEQQ